MPLIGEHTDASADASVFWPLSTAPFRSSVTYSSCASLCSHGGGRVLTNDQSATLPQIPNKRLRGGVPEQSPRGTARPSRLSPFLVALLVMLLLLGILAFVILLAALVVRRFDRLLAIEERRKAGLPTDDLVWTRKPIIRWFFHRDRF